MNIFRRFTAATSLLLLAALAGGAAPAPPATASPTPASPAPAPRGTLEAPTIEPTLALVVDLGVEGIEKKRGGLEARLVLDLRAFAELKDLVIRPILPPDLTAEDADAIPGKLARLGRGPARRFVLPLHAAGVARREIRVEVEFDDEQGRRFRLGQGVTLDPDPAPEGRVVAGAYEVMGTSIEKVHP